MAVKSGFFNSVNGDRKYSAEEFSSLISMLVTDGVIPNDENEFEVTPGSSLNVLVGEGRAWFNNIWFNVDRPTSITLETPFTNMERMDAIVIEVNHEELYREASIKVIKGPQGTAAVRPVVEQSDLVHRYPIAYVKVQKNATTISTNDIEWVIGFETLYATSKLEQTDISVIMAQYNVDFRLWLSNLKNELNETQLGELTNLLIEVQDLTKEMLGYKTASLSGSTYTMNEDVPLINGEYVNIILNAEYVMSDNGDIPKITFARTYPTQTFEVYRRGDLILNVLPPNTILTMQIDMETMRLYVSAPISDKYWTMVVPKNTSIEVDRLISSELSEILRFKHTTSSLSQETRLYFDPTYAILSRRIYSSDGVLIGSAPISFTPAPAGYTLTGLQMREIVGDTTRIHVAYTYKSSAYSLFGSCWIYKNDIIYNRTITKYNEYSFDGGFDENIVAMVMHGPSNSVYFTKSDRTDPLYKKTYNVSTPTTTFTVPAGLMTWIDEEEMICTVGSYSYDLQTGTQIQTRLHSGELFRTQLWPEKRHHAVYKSTTNVKVFSYANKGFDKIIDSDQNVPTMGTYTAWFDYDKMILGTSSYVQFVGGSPTNVRYYAYNILTNTLLYNVMVSSDMRAINWKPTIIPVSTSNGYGARPISSIIDVYTGETLVSIPEATVSFLPDIEPDLLLSGVNPVEIAYIDYFTRGDLP